MSHFLSQGCFLPICCKLHSLNVGEAMNIELEQETDGRWIAEIPDLPGVMCYGETKELAAAAVKVLALRVLADREDL